jgi:hypothetical protein
LSIPGSELLVPQLKASLADQPAPVAHPDH